MKIRWEDFEPNRYEEMVAVLLSRLHPDSQRIDGKGGDGGRDVQIVAPGGDRLIHVFELKSFTGRMDPNRRKQVKRSLKRATILKPLRWTLIVPIDPTPKEEEWFSHLNQEYNLETKWQGKTWLDEKMAAHPDIYSYFVENAKDEAMQWLVKLREEQAMVTSAPDAAGRLQHLYQRLNEIDPYFRYELSTGARPWDSRPKDLVMSVIVKNTQVDVYEKYVDALRDHPITASVKLKLGPGDEILRKNIQSSVDYGLPVTIPSSAVTNFSVDAPAGLGGSFTDIELTIGSADAELDEPFNLTLNVMKGDCILSSLLVKVTRRNVGFKGATIGGYDETGWLHVQFTANIINMNMNVKFRLEPKPVTPASVLPLLGWMRALCSSLQLVIIFPGGAQVSAKGLAIHDGESGFEVVEALAYLQHRSGVYFPMPIDISRDERNAILDSAALLEKGSAEFVWSTFSVLLDRNDLEVVTFNDGSPIEVVIEANESLQLGESTIPIGRIRYQFESAQVADLEHVKQEIKEGHGTEVEIVPGENNKGQKFLIS